MTAALTHQIYASSGCNVTPTEPGYCPFYDQFGAHAYMGGRSGGDPAREHEEGWTTCCDVDTEEQPKAADPGILCQSEIGWT